MLHSLFGYWTNFFGVPSPSQAACQRLRYFLPE